MVGDASGCPHGPYRNPDLCVECSFDREQTVKERALHATSHRKVVEALGVYNGGTPCIHTERDCVVLDDLLPNQCWERGDDGRAATPRRGLFRITVEFWPEGHK